MQSLLRIAVFYDGYYFDCAQNYFFGHKKGWLSLRQFHKFLERYVSKKIQGDFEYKVVYAGWYQGLYTIKNTDEKQLKRDRRKHHDLMHAGIESKFYPMSEKNNKEKGVDVAMAIDVFENCLAGIFDVAVLVTGDGDFVPLARALMKHSVIVINSHFNYQEENGAKSYSNERLQKVCNHVININSLENDNEYKEDFNNLFRKIDSTSESDYYCEK